MPETPKMNASALPRNPSIDTSKPSLAWDDPELDVSKPAFEADDPETDPGTKAAFSLDE
jgi:hypothetical protein